MIRILIIDDQKLVLENLAALLKSESEFDIVGTAEDGQQGIELVERLKPDIAIIDLTMPRKNGIETTYFINQHYPQTKVIIYTSSSRQMLNKAILVGARGYLLKETSMLDLAAAIHAVHRGNIYIGKGILDRVQLSSVDSQKSRIEYINSWLAKEIINHWRDCTSVQSSTAEKITEDLNLNQAGLVRIKECLCYQKDKSITVVEEAISEIKILFTSIEDSVKPEQTLKESRQLILDILEGNSISGYPHLHTLQNNFRSLQAATSNQLSQTISSLSQQASPLPLLAFFQSTQKYLLDWQEFLNQKANSNLEKRDSALDSFEYLLKSRKKLANKRDICEKAVILACKTKIDAEVYSLSAQIVAEAIAQFEAQTNILNQSNGFLLESIKQLEQRAEFAAQTSAKRCHPEEPTLMGVANSDSVAFIPYIEELQKRTSIKKLQSDLEKTVGHSLNQWGVEQSVSHEEVNGHLLEMLEPITYKIYVDLRREALAISFLEYAQDDNHCD